MTQLTFDVTSTNWSTIIELPSYFEYAPQMDRESSAFWTETALLQTSNPANLVNIPLANVRYDGYAEVLWANTAQTVLSVYHNTSMLRTRSPLRLITKHAEKEPGSGGRSNNNNNNNNSNNNNRIRRVFSSTKGVAASGIQAETSENIVDVFTQMIHGITVVCRNGIRFITRGGVLLSCVMLPSADKIESALLDDYTNTLWLASSSQLMQFDLMTSKIVQTVNTDSSATVLRLHHNMLVAGRADGIIEWRDLRVSSKFKIQRSLAHPGAITDLDCRNNMVVSCGCIIPLIDNSTSLNERIHATRSDAVFKVFDLRTSAVVTAQPMLGGPRNIRFLPQFSSSVCVVNRSGVWQIRDVEYIGPTSYQNVQQVTALDNDITCLDVSSTGDCIAFGTYSGIISEWSSQENAFVNSSSEPTDFAGPPERPHFASAVDSVDFSFADVALPFAFYEQPLCSSYWVLEDYAVEQHKQYAASCFEPFPPYPPIPPLDVSLLADVKFRDFVGYAKNPNSIQFPPNCVSTLVKFGASKRVVEKRSQRDFGALLNNPERRDAVISPEYAKVTIKIPKLGLHAFNFSSYNQSPFTGLDNLLPNSYCNSALQLLYFIPELRAHMLRHVCEREYCLSCELGFLFHILGHSSGRTVEPRNFLRALQQVPEVNALGLLDALEVSSELLLAVKVQDLMRFLLECLKKEDFMSRQVKPTIIDVLFESSYDVDIFCEGGSHRSSRVTKSYTLKMIYPAARQIASFEHILKLSIMDESKRRVFCPTCNTYQWTRQCRRLTQLPYVLNIAANVNTDSQLDYWRMTNHHTDDPTYNKQWLPDYIEIALLNDSEINVTRLSEQQARDRSQELKSLAHDTAHSSSLRCGVFELYGIISHVIDPPEKDSSLNTINGEHLVVHLKVPAPSTEYVVTDSSDASSLSKSISANSNNSSWWAFNDFVIRPSTVHNATDFQCLWKQPCEVVFKRMDVEPISDCLPVSKSPFKEKLGIEYPSLSSSFDEARKTFKPLSVNETSMCCKFAIDCEFVSVEAATEESLPDGTIAVARPARLSLARVSVVRGEGPDAGLPCIDDYIVESEMVVDYLTQYSGLLPGDLDRHSSPHHLLTSKQVYVKLRALVDSGMTFIGHGLTSDFRMINIYVPPSQIVDTVELYYLPSRRRKLGLRFLARHVLHVTIQEDKHDSIEDSRTALALYNHYLTMQTAGFEYVQSQLEKLYDIGQKHGFKM